jgi:hypothetical protein
MAKSDRWVNAGDLLSTFDRDRARDKSAENARVSEVLHRRAVGGVPDDAYYMKEVGKEGIKRQQENMKAEADDYQTGYEKKRVAGKKTGGVHKQGMSTVGGKKRTVKKRVAGK